MPRKVKRYSEGEETFLLSGTGKSKSVCATDRVPFRMLSQEACVKYHDVGKRAPLKSSRDVVQFIHGQVTPGDRQQEMFWVICVDVRNQPLAMSEPFRGGRSSINIDMSVLLQGVVLSGASSFIVAHNHPSGSSSPSDEDVVLTKRLAKAADYINTKLLDHIIVVYDPLEYFSFLDAGLLPTPQAGQTD